MEKEQIIGLIKAQLAELDAPLPLTGHDIADSLIKEQRYGRRAALLDMWEKVNAL